MLEKAVRVLGVKYTTVMFKKPRTKVVACTPSPTKAQRKV